MTETKQTDAHERLKTVRLLALDVDGTLTDGGVYYDDAGGETKRFHIHDGLGIVLAQMAGLKIIWITGRTSSIVQKRAGELKVPLVMQGVRDKGAALGEAAQSLGVPLAQCAFMGDDLNDLPGFAAAAVCGLARRVSARCLDSPSSRRKQPRGLADAGQDGFRLQ